jgi:hypothetical protein
MSIHGRLLLLFIALGVMLGKSPVVKMTASGIYCRRNRVAKNRRPTATKGGMDG